MSDAELIALFSQVSGPAAGKTPEVPAGGQAPTGLGNNLGAGIAEGFVGIPTGVADLGRLAATGTAGNTNQATWDAIERWTGPRPQANTPLEKAVRTVGEFGPGAAFGPGGMARKLLTYGVIPGITSEYAKSLPGFQGNEGLGGAVGGVAGVGLGMAANRGISGVQNMLAGRSAGREITQILGQPVGSGAASRLADALVGDRVTPIDVMQTRARLGPEAMFMDISDGTKGRAEGLASIPGPQRNTIVNAVQGRTEGFDTVTGRPREFGGAGIAERVQQTLNAEMGPTQNVVQLVDRVNQTVDRVARPLYQQVMAAHQVVDVPVTITQRPAVQEAMRNARTLAANYGETIDITARPSLQAWDYVKKDLDRRINAYQRSGGASELSSADKADMGGLMDARRALVQHLDQVTNGAYQQARQVAAHKFELREALDFGRDAYSSKMLPEEFAAEVQQMSLPQRAMVAAGFRRELEKLIGSASNEGIRSRTALMPDNVMQKVETLFGPDAAREIGRRIEAETSFQLAKNKILGGSPTIPRSEQIKDIKDPDPTNRMQYSVTGLPYWLGGKVFDYARSAAQGLPATRQQMANVLTTTGNNIDPVAEALMRLGDRRTMNSAAVGNKATALANALLSGR